ncbi:MAG TPA: hypothetical protein VFY39_16000, partial [Gammaproteobacteria bacterium]|nr:hypothetical protein [Gammaproteobacteria bacterium]
ELEERLEEQHVPAEQHVPTAESVSAEQHVPTTESAPAEQRVPADQSVPVEQSIPAEQSVPEEQSLPEEQSAPEEQHVPTAQDQREIENAEATAQDVPSPFDFLPRETASLRGPFTCSTEHAPATAEAEPEKLAVHPSEEQDEPDRGMPAARRS